MISKTILLDAGGGVLLLLIPAAFIIHFIITVVIESLILLGFKYGSFIKCVKHILLANFISLIAGLLLIKPFAFLATIDKGEYSSAQTVVYYEINIVLLVSLFYLATIIIEGIILKLVNKKFETKKLILATFIMNLVTYIPIYLILRWTGI